MDPKLNRENFYRVNSGDIRESGPYTNTFNYSYYIQFRLNNTLLLLNNPELMEELGLNKAKLLLDARKLIALSETVTIPDVVLEPKKRKLFLTRLIRGK